MPTAIGVAVVGLELDGPIVRRDGLLREPERISTLPRFVHAVGKFGLSATALS
jgi:hypothetical protein